MPELPEVETVRRGLSAGDGGRAHSADRDCGGRICGFRFPNDGGSADRPADHLAWPAGEIPDRRFDDGTALGCHLGMSGSFRVEDEERRGTPGLFHHARSKDGAHDHVVFQLESPDGRRPAGRIQRSAPVLGFMFLTPKEELHEHPYLKGLGIEPTGNALDGKALAKALAGRNAPLKAALLDQRTVAGLGNIYVCEALWRAGLSPKRGGERWSAQTARRPNAANGWPTRSDR
jgi:formamidopyrimidine-DNA glycosylase